MTWCRLTCQSVTDKFSDHELLQLRRKIVPNPQYPEQSLGERRVRLSFNPSSNAEVDHIKRETAAMIDWLANTSTRPTSSLGEQQRLISLAMDAYEDAAMWAVKAVTS
jgi:hypothetical protein